MKRSLKISTWNLSLKLKKYGSLNQLHKNNKSYFNQQQNPQTQILQNIQRLGLITPQREFKLIGSEYSYQVINYRIKQIKNKHQAVKDYMLTSYNKNLDCIETALLQIQDTRNLVKTRQKSTKLKQNISRLRNLIDKTMKITRHNIKLKNIKNTLKILEKIPNIKKMTLFELKNINLEQVDQFKKSIFITNPNSRQKQFKCIQHLQFFIDKASSQHLRLIINSITDCLTHKFQNHKYQQAIKNFIISKSNVEYQKLFIRLVEGEIRDKIEQQISKSQQQNKLYLRCQRYITILINVFKIFRWHRYNLAAADISENIQSKIRERNNSVLSNRSDISQQKGPVINLDEQASIKINTQQIKNHICSLMDHCLKQQIEELLFNDSIKNEQIFQILTLINRFFQLSFSFSSYIFLQTKNQIKEILMRKCYKLQQKGLKDFNEALSIQQGNQWSRLPVLKNFRYKNIQKTIQKIKKLSLYQKIPSLTVQHFKFLNVDYRHQNQEDFQLKVAQQKQDDFQFVEFRFPSNKLEKMSSFQIVDTPLPQHDDSQVVFCQSSVTILNYFDQFLSMYFYFPIQEIRIDILDKMSFYIEYYIYYLFETFLSEMYKKYFFDVYETVEQKYLQMRTKKLYQTINHFLISFKKDKQNNQPSPINNSFNNQQNGKMSIELKRYKARGFSFIKKQIKQSKVSSQNTVKARAIATDSIKFVLAYFQHILVYLQKSTLPNEISNQNSNLLQKQLMNVFKNIENYKKLQIQMSDLLLTDNVPTTTKIDFVVPIMKKIKWHQLQNTKEVMQYGLIILKNIKEVYQKMKSMGKGELPFYIVDRIFSFYWKTQLTFLTKTFLQQHANHKQKGGKTAKIAFQKLIDSLYQGLVNYLIQRFKSKQTTTSPLKYDNSQQNDKRLQQFRLSYLKIKNIFPILFESDWIKCKQMIQSSLKNVQFIYKIQINILKGSECCSGLSLNQIQQKHQEIDQFIIRTLLKQ